eukprot:symbB.v1.2.009456.t3/scaffold601.1/size182750/20
MTSEDAEALWQYQKQFTALMVSWNENERIPIPSEVRDSLELKGWSELTAIEKSEDVFTGTLIGPLYGNGQQSGGQRGYYYDLENGESIFGSQGGKSLSLKEVGGWVTTFQRAVQGLLALSEAPEDDGAASSNSPQATFTRRRSLTKSMTAFFGQTSLPKEVDNLPWRVLLRLTQVLQCCWIFLGISEGLCNWFPRTFGVDIFRSHWGKLAPLVEGVDLHDPEDAEGLCSATNQPCASSRYHVLKTMACLQGETSEEHHSHEVSEHSGEAGHIAGPSKESAAVEEHGSEGTQGLGNLSGEFLIKVSCSWQTIQPPQHLAPKRALFYVIKLESFVWLLLSSLSTFLCLSLSVLSFLLFFPWLLHRDAKKAEIRCGHLDSGGHSWFTSQSLPSKTDN